MYLILDLDDASIFSKLSHWTIITLKWNKTRNFRISENNWKLFLRWKVIETSVKINHFWPINCMLVSRPILQPVFFQDSLWSAISTCWSLSGPNGEHCALRFLPGDLVSCCLEEQSKSSLTGDICASYALPSISSSSSYHCK